MYNIYIYACLSAFFSLNQKTWISENMYLSGKLLEKLKTSW